MTDPSAATWCSPWAEASTKAATDGPTSIQTLPDNSGGIATISSLPLKLTHPEGSISVPCQVSLQWGHQPLRCTKLKLEIKCSARHVELYVDGTRHNMLGEEEQGEVYLGTFRGTKQEDTTVIAATEQQTFVMSPSFSHTDRDCSVLQNVQTIRVKFVSLTGDKRVLRLQELKCIFVPMKPVAVDTRVPDMAAQLGGLHLGGAVGGAAASDVQTILRSFQQTLEREMETKIARAIDAKLSTLSQRLAFSEQALFQLHKKMDVKDAHVQANLNQIQHKFSQLEAQLNQFTASQESKEKTEAEEIEPLEVKEVTDEDTEKAESQETETVAEADSTLDTE
ncbi:hypothetical protein BBO99_00002185 [Phytophthora kernoviae]|uniref:Uncharacterized protein n=2 Tax=Phytophthora kernoviae TaxID=325452 RepID=A0A421EYI5_9STRA|nr:hypothetical protein G195_002493 [Phytophthora kernoviae 00238/432]KAG2529855.1 hypothetical protein JM16_001808 [Phytophthora kernoviae]RLN10613.1 hypothetical protein BBI17_001895 [Phytophthora kernoviae]RLN83342.1 hypothetical protein BBO99_00002185 [Phytophthora kernoviae]